MIIEDNVYKKHNNNIINIIDILLDIINNKDILISKKNYYYHKNDRDELILLIYLYRLLVYSEDIIIKKDKDYKDIILNRLKNKNNIVNYDISKITNIEVKDELQLLNKIKIYIKDDRFIYNKVDKRLEFNNGEYIDTRWLLAYLSLLFDNKNREKNKDNIEICCVMPNKGIDKCSNIKEIDEFFKCFNYYKLLIKYSSSSILLNNRMEITIKNAASKYLYHLRQFRDNKESEESYKIFYNVLKNECHKNGMILEEEIRVLSDVDSDLLDRLKRYITSVFTTYKLDTQIKIIDDIIWKTNNNMSIINSIDVYINTLISLIEHLNIRDDNLTYNILKEEYSINDIHVVLILIVLKFVIMYLHNDIDYSRLDLTNIKPKYMSNVENVKEKELIDNIKKLIKEVNDSKNELDKYKFERQSITKEHLGNKYMSELELCISNINRVSIDISTKETIIENMKKELYDIRLSNSEKYENIDLYKNNYSIIKHIVNAFITGGFYLKTNNSNEIYENIIVIEDYVDTDNTFYIEVTFNELMDILERKINDDLPKLK